MQNAVRVKSHHAGANRVQHREIVGRNELSKESFLSLHGSVLIETVGGVHDSEPSPDESRNEREFPVKFLVLKESEVRRIAPPKVLHRETDRRHRVYFE